MRGAIECAGQQGRAMRAIHPNDAVAPCLTVPQPSLDRLLEHYSRFLHGVGAALLEGRSKPGQS